MRPLDELWQFLKLISIILLNPLAKLIAVQKRFYMLTVPIFPYCVEKN